MNTIETIAREFLDQKCIAVAGVSARRQTPANAILKALRARGTTVYAVNPSIDAYQGERCYPDFESLPQKPDGVVIVTKPATAEALVREAVALGVSRVWMHNMLGTRNAAASRNGSVSNAAVELCRQHGVTVIAGSCPMQFVGDLGHRCMRHILRFTGALAPA